MHLDDMPCYFLGANAPKGYYSGFGRLFSAAPKGKCFLLKGGPGCGKSTMLKKIALMLKEKGVSTELIYCTADTDSLDAVITQDGSFCALDATLPHAVEPKYPGIYETTVSLSDCWDEEKLKKNAEKASKLFDENRKKHEQARKFIAAAADLLEEAEKAETEAMNEEKTVKAALRICSKEFGKRTPKKGSEKIRFISGITDKGVCFLNKTPGIFCDKIYLLEDDCGAVSKLFMNTVRKSALEHGLDIITCRCPVFPSEKTEHIFIPSLRLGFMTENRRHKTDILPYRTLHAKRFIDEKAFSRKKLRLRFALRTAARLIEEASDCMREAKGLHDELEEIYIRAMDFSKVEEKFREITEKI